MLDAYMTDQPDPAPPRYAVLETRDLVESHKLVDRAADAEVLLAPIRGGMVTGFRIGADELLFIDRGTLRDLSQNVRGGIPILFPFAGRLHDDTLIVDGQRFPMAQHGFARRMAWHIAGSATDGAASMTLTLDSSEATLATWPFPFRLTFRYELRDGALTIRQQFGNVGDRTFTIHPGLHPYFFVESARKSAAAVTSDGLTAYDNRTGLTGPLAFPLDLAAGELDLQILDHRAPTVGLTRPDAPPLVLTLGPEQRVVTVWTLPGRDFVCVEPWTRPSNAVNNGQGLVVPPRGALETSFTITRGAAGGP
jgi:galactose mutarotase-like enzyme